MLALYAEVARTRALEHGVAVASGDEQKRPLALALDLAEHRLHHHRALLDHRRQSRIVLHFGGGRGAPGPMRAARNGRLHDELGPAGDAAKLAERRRGAAV